MSWLWFLLTPLAPVVWTSVWVVGAHFVARGNARMEGATLPSRPLSEWPGVWGGEVVAVLWMQWWHLGFLTSDRRIDVEERTGPLVVCVHGFTQNSSNFRGIRRALAEVGRPSAAISMGYPPRRLPRYTEVLERRLDAILEAEERVDVACHSMGGIVLRMLLSERPDLRLRVRKVVTIGTPHRGTTAARLAFWPPEVVFMRRDGEELGGLPMLSELLGPDHITAIGSGDDTVVYPLDTTIDPNATHVALPAMGHAGILYWPEAIQAVITGLEGKRRP